MATICCLAYLDVAIALQFSHKVHREVHDAGWFGFHQQDEIIAEDVTDRWTFQLLLQLVHPLELVVEVNRHHADVVEEVLAEVLEKSWR